MRFEHAKDYLESQLRGRPQTLKEISLSVQKSEFSVIRELNGLILRGEVYVHTVQFNGRKVPFYTMRKDVSITVEQHSRGRPVAWNI